MTVPDFVPRPSASVFAPDLLSGGRVIVTGGGSGLGRATAARLLAHGADVVIWGRRGGVLEETAAALNAETGPGAGRCVAQGVNVRDAEAVEAAVGSIWATEGAVTGLVNGAAANFIAETAGLSPRAFEAVTATVMTGSYNATLACGRRWIEAGIPGSVVSLLTTWIWSGSAFVVPAAMAKSAVHSMTMSLAVEWGRFGIRLNGIAAGPIPTEFAWDVLNPTESSSSGATQKDAIPAGRFGTPDELANLVLFLLSDACPYITGTTIAMDGGQHLAGPGTFAGLTSMTSEEWAEARAVAQRAAEQSKAQRTA